MNNTISVNKNKLETSLFLMRLTIFIVMLVWTLDKFTNPDHAVRIMDGFYNISLSSNTVIMIIGILEMLIIIAFMAGLWKKYTYGFVLILHGLSTFSSWKQYINMDLLFYAAWPMLAACAALYMLRDHDVKYTLGK